MKKYCHAVFLPLEPPKNILLPKELLWRFTKYSKVLWVILTGRVGRAQISKKISTDALSIKCHHLSKIA